ncbi:MAG: phosphate uptake regulator PhoU [Aigarchaeota archaeon]|nr:phosphate uptake regulator PhoU [Aigarchaeota archaeon]MDW7986859.1 phosphate uptake regulator PhoU [Nitrososphaerota archaeon]
MPVYSRKVQKTGGTTFIVSLPQEWVRNIGLKPHDELYMMEEPSGELILWPKFLDERESYEEGTVKIPADAGPEDILRLYISMYITGFNIIKLEFGETGYRHTKELKEMIRRWLVGVEIVSESFYGLVTQCLPTHDSLQPLKVIERMADLAASMQRDALYAIENNDEALARDIIERDYDVDRFYHFIVRQLNKGVSSPRRLATLGLKNIQEALSYIIVAKTIERAADHATSIANFMIRERRAKSPPPELIKAGYEASDLFTEAKTALLKTDVMKARQIMKKIELLERKLIEITQEEGVECEMDAAIHMLGRDIYRIVEYSSDICEATLNLGARYGVFTEKK